MHEERYIELFNDFKSLVDKQFDYFENGVINNHELAKSLPALISLVNVIGYLRGQDGIFLNFRPHTDKQKYFYQIEDEFENRLRELIAKVSGSTEAEFYERRLHEYFCEARKLPIDKTSSRPIL